ncbi:aspartic peptidase domain-containing protein [Globomyces pollinis-pini]|nr:aspartic peptidase domain-containing protein [Globomyces pollinis-pini]
MVIQKTSTYSLLKREEFSMERFKLVYGRTSHRKIESISERRKRAVGSSAPPVLLGSAPLANHNDMFWTCPVSIGSGQILNLNLDTGSADSWVRGLSCVSEDNSCEGMKLDDSDSALINMRDDFNLRYASGSLKASIFLAPVAIGEFVTTIPIGVTTFARGLSGFDGLLGMGFNSISQMSVKLGGKSVNFFDSLDLPPENQIFSFFLSNSIDGTVGQLTLGGSNPFYYEEPVHYILLNAETYWQFDISQMTYNVGSTSGAVASGYVTNAIADTGTSMIYLPYSAANDINNAIGAIARGNGFYSIPCEAAFGPDVNFVMGGVTYAIPAKIYVLVNLDGSCLSGFNAKADGMGMVILGDVFHRAFYSIYDKFNKRIGFAKAIHREV